MSIKASARAIHLCKRMYNLTCIVTLDFSFWRLAIQTSIYSHLFTSLFLSIITNPKSFLPLSQNLTIICILLFFFDNEPRREHLHGPPSSTIWASLLCPLQLLQHCSCGNFTYTHFSSYMINSFFNYGEPCFPFHI